MQPLEVRPARPEELDEVGRITVAAYEALLGAELGEYRAELQDAAGRAANATLLVAAGPDGLAGTATYVEGPTSPLHEFDDDDAASIRMLAVDPAFQGRGAGRRLAQACVDRARADGRRRVMLYSTEPMVVARGMYERMGFRRDEARDWPFEREDGSTFVLLCYVLDLDAPAG